MAAAALWPQLEAAGLKFEKTPDLSDEQTRARLTPSAMVGFFSIMDKWHVGLEEQAQLLDMGRSNLHRLRRKPQGTRSQDEMMRISYIIAIYKDLHILLGDYPLADEWMTRPNDNILFGGSRPLDIALRYGIVGLSRIRQMLDAARGGL